MQKCFIIFFCFIKINTFYADSGRYEFIFYFANILDSKWIDINWLYNYVLSIEYFYYYLCVCHHVLKILNNASILNFVGGF